MVFGSGYAFVDVLARHRPAAVFNVTPEILHLIVGRLLSSAYAGVNPNLRVRFQ
jgi:hypothetical protein